MFFFKIIAAKIEDFSTKRHFTRFYFGVISENVYFCQQIMSKMSTATLTNLLEFLYGILTPSNQKWLGEHLIEHAKQEEYPMRPYTKEELLQMAETGRKQIADGYYYTTEEVISACAEEPNYK